MRSGAVTIKGLREFQSALRAVDRAAARQLTRGLRRAGEPVLERSRDLAHVGTQRSRGGLASGYKIQVRGATAFIQQAEAYGPGAEWGQDGKWSGFRRYGPRGTRFAGRAVEERSEQVFDIVTHELADLLTINGWAR